MDFAKLFDQATSDPTRELSLRAVAAHYGTESEPDKNAQCPFHEDDSPSLSFFTGHDGKERFNCHGCGKKGDVIDWIQFAEGLSYGAAKDRARELVREGLPEPDPAAAQRAPLRDFADELADSSLDYAVLENFLLGKKLDIDLDWLTTEFRVRTRGAQILMPHYPAGLGAAPNAIKWREGKDKRALPGSRLTELYGVWRDRGNKDVILCEGESDTWALASWMDTTTDVLGLPRGVAAQVDAAWIERLSNRRVTLLFDADGAGRMGLKRWVRALLGKAESVRIAFLPEGLDATDAGAEAVQDALRGAEPVDPQHLSLPVVRKGQGFAMLKQLKDQEEPTPVLFTYWSFEVLARAQSDAGVVFTIKRDNGLEDQILSRDLTDAGSFTKWAAKRGRPPQGLTTTMVNGLHRLLENESLYVLRERGVDAVGLHGRSFVLPGRTIGHRGLAYLPADDPGWADTVKAAMANEDQAKALVRALAWLHKPEVMTPILGWFAAAPLRSWFKTGFPTLAVTGSAGSGKTTIVSEVQRALGFGAGVPRTISDTTAHAVWTLAGSSQGVPLWFDEYRKGAREDGMSAVNQAIRDGWDGSATLKGGHGEHGMGVRERKSLAPIVITGEDAFSEVSHAERMVIVPLRKGEQTPEALGAVRAFGDVSASEVFLRFLLGAPEHRMRARQPRIMNRSEQAIAVAEWGYALLLAWVGAEGMPAWTPDLVVGQQQQMKEHEPYVEALRVGMDLSAGGVVTQSGADLLVQPSRLVPWVKRNTDIVLPGGSTALAAWLKERFPETRPAVAPSGGSALLVPGGASVLALDD